MSITMAYDADYLYERRVILARLFDTFTKEDARKFNEQCIDLIRCGTAPVHVILDVRDIRNVTVSIRDMFTIMSARREPQLGCVLVVGDYALDKYKLMLNIVLSSGGVSYHLIKSMDLNDALAALGKLEPTLQLVQV